MVTAIHSAPRSPPQGLARLVEEGHLPLAQVAGLVRQPLPNRPRQIQVYLGRRMRLGARLEAVLLLTSQRQALSGRRRVVCLFR